MECFWNVFELVTKVSKENGFHGHLVFLSFQLFQFQMTLVAKGKLPSVLLIMFFGQNCLLE